VRSGVYVLWKVALGHGRRTGGRFLWRPTAVSGGLTAPARPGDGGLLGERLCGSAGDLHNLGTATSRVCLPLESSLMMAERKGGARTAPPKSGRADEATQLFIAGRQPTRLELGRQWTQ
jgi:hypothetical protein